MVLMLVMMLAFPAFVAEAAPVPLVLVDGRVLELDVDPVLQEGRILVPVRPIFEALGATVHWDETARTVMGLREETVVILTIGEKNALVDGETVALDVPGQIVRGRTLIPLRFVSEAMGAWVNWDSGTFTVSISTDSAGSGASPAPSRGQGVTTETRSITVDGRAVTARLVRLLPGAQLKPVVALGENRVGGVEDLAEMAKRNGAVVAINGTFFNPADYAQNNKLPTEPYGTLITGGKVIHVGTVGSVVGFSSLSQAGMELLRIKVEGATEGSYSWPNNWYAYGFNRTPSGSGATSSFIFTPERGERVGFSYGMKVVVRNGRVVAIEHDVDVAIPKDGYVIVLTGRERDQLGGRFAPGKSVEYRVRFTDSSGKEVSWPYTESVGAGPLLLRSGVLQTNYAAQGFVDQKILELRGRRSAIGLTRDGSILLVVADNVQVKELASVMQQFGADTAMNLDGGASSGLWVNGSYMVQPGRKLSNALIWINQ